MNSDNRRARIREEIKNTSRDAFILKEMKRLGFWPDDKEKPHVAEELIKRQQQLGQEIRELSKQARQYQDEEAVLNRYRKERLKKSRETQKANKKKREDERLVRKAAWKRQQQIDISYLGEHYSKNLHKKENNLERFAALGLPIIQDVRLLSVVLQTTVSELRFLAYFRQVSRVSHYLNYTIAKKDGSRRQISAPKPRLKKVQRAILDEILNKLSIDESAHGFCNNRSILTNAQPHINADVVVNFDLKDFFHSITYPRIWGLFRSLGFSDQLSTILALICSESEQNHVIVDGEKLCLSSIERHLPQGAPTSPAITNLICRKLDRRMAGVAKRLGFTYTRYADDMTFSGDQHARKKINALRWQVRAVVKSEDFALHPDKTHIMTNGMRKEVTGIVVNEKPAINRKKLKKFRALLHQIEHHGPQGKSWGESDDLFASIIGYARFVHMVNPEKGRIYLTKVNQLCSTHAPHLLPSKKKKKKNPEKHTPAINQKKKPWWRFW